MGIVCLISGGRGIASKISNPSGNGDNPRIVPGSEPGFSWILFWNQLQIYQYIKVDPRLWLITLIINRYAIANPGGFSVVEPQAFQNSRSFCTSRGGPSGTLLRCGPHRGASESPVHYKVPLPHLNFPGRCLAIGDAIHETGPASTFNDSSRYEPFTEFADMQAIHDGIVDREIAHTKMT